MRAKKKNILLLGYGEMGHTMEFLFSRHHTISIWDPYYQGDLADCDLDTTAATADYVIFCTPTLAIHELAQRISAQLQPDCICLSMAKSLDDAGRTAVEALQQGLHSSSEYAFLYGPMISEEILTGKPGFALLATSSLAATTDVQQLFNNTLLKLIPNEDVMGSTWCAVLKNVYAPIFGMADELSLGDNMRGFLAVQTLHELAEIMLLKQGQPETPYTLAGLGDLITTATSKDSHHHELGMQLARNERDDIHGEGINTLNMVHRLGLLDTNNYPLFKLVEEVVLHDGDPRQLLGNLINELSWCSQLR